MCVCWSMENQPRTILGSFAEAWEMDEREKQLVRLSVSLSVPAEPTLYCCVCARRPSAAQQTQHQQQQQRQHSN